MDNKAAEALLGLEERTILRYVRVNSGSDGRAIREAVFAAHGQSSPSTVDRRIDRLITSGLIERHGNKRAARYTAHGPLDLLEAPYQQRKPVDYNFDTLDKFTPNEDGFFDDAERAQLLKAGEMPGGTRLDLFMHRVFERFMVDLSYASSKMEGNTYSLLDTEKLLVDGESDNKKTIEEARMLLNHKQTIVYLMENASELEISSREIKNIHSLLSQGLVAPGEPGKLRQKIVEITMTSYKPIDTPAVIEDRFRLLIEKARAIKDPFDQSLFLMAHISYLQPFIDVNKRTGRLSANIPMIAAGLCPISYRDINAVSYKSGLLLFYETQDISALRDAFYLGYIGSAERLKLYASEPRRQVSGIEVVYDRAIKSAVRMAVRRAIEDGANIDDTVEKVLASAPASDREAITKHVAELLEHVEPDSAVIYDLLPSEVEQYQQLKEPKPTP
jgi:hypothetical protein